MSRLQASKGKKKWFSSLEERGIMPTLKIKADSRRHAIQTCNYSNQIKAFLLESSVLEIETIIGVKNVKGNNAARQREFTSENKSK